MPFCTACGRHNPDEARFCSQCGTKLVSPDSGEGTEAAESTATITFGVSKDKTDTSDRQLSPVDAAAVDALPVISLFSGAGGLDLGVERAGNPPLVDGGVNSPYRVAVATDYEQAALDTLSRNCHGVPTICRDIRMIPTAELLDVTVPLGHGMMGGLWLSKSVADPLEETHGRRR